MSKKKTTLIAILTVVFILVFSTLFADSNITHFAPEYGVTTANVNLRNMPTLNYSSYITTLSTGTKVKVVGTIDNYYIVQLEDNRVGIVSKDYVDITGEKTEGLVYTDYLPFYGSVISDDTIVRGGPSTSFSVYTKLNSGDKVYVIGAIDDFLLVITEDNLVGMIRNDLIEYESQDESDNITQEDDDTQNESNNLEVTIDNAKDYILEKINEERENAGVTLLSIDSLLQSVAQAKAQDMVDNDYFLHTSPTYGTPFEMMQNAGVTYITAGENIAGNSSIEDAIMSFLESDEHSKNILSNAYNYIGIGIKESDKYGYIIVLMFIGK